MMDLQLIMLDRLGALEKVARVVGTLADRQKTLLQNLLLQALVLKSMLILRLPV